MDWLSSIGFPYLNFFLFAGLLVYFGKRPTKAFVAKKREEFEKLFAEASSARAEAEVKLQEVNNRLLNLQTEIEAIHQRAIAEAKIESDRIIEKSHQVAERIRQDAHEAANQELVEARRTLQQQIIEQVKGEVTERFKAKMTYEDQQRSIASRLSGMDLKRV